MDKYTYEEERLKVEKYIKEKGILLKSYNQKEIQQLFMRECLEWDDEAKIREKTGHKQGQYSIDIERRTRLLYDKLLIQPTDSDAELYLKQLRRKLRDMNSYGAGHSSDHSDDDSYGPADLYSKQKNNLGDHESEGSISEPESESSSSVIIEDDRNATDELNFQFDSDSGSDGKEVNHDHTSSSDPHVRYHRQLAPPPKNGRPGGGGSLLTQSRRSLLP